MLRNITTLACSLCPSIAEYSHGEERFCRACADAVATQGPAPMMPDPDLCRDCGERIGHAAECIYAGLGVACDFDECGEEAAERRDALQLCGEHCRQHDALMARTIAEQAVLRDCQVAALTRHLEAAQAAMVAWFIDPSWLIFLEVSPRGLGLSLERSAATVGSCTLRADSDVRALARQLVLAAEEVS